MSRGKLKQNGVHLREHEYKTVKLFLEAGYDIELLPKSTIKDYHQGDFIMDGVEWEAKAINLFKKEFLKSNGLKRMKIVKKSSEILDFSK